MQIRLNRRADKPVNVLLVAAVIVLILYCAMGVATMLGWMPGTLGSLLAPQLPQPHQQMPAPDVIAAAPAARIAG